jgi:hypothetical protein
MLRDLFGFVNKALEILAPTESSRAIPHPEELMNPAATLENSNVPAVIERWLTAWEVPAQFHNYWKTAVAVQVYTVYPPSILAMGISQDAPAATWIAGGRRQLAIKPQWINPGVLAHEMAHNSFTLLSPEQKTSFAALHTAYKGTDQLIKLLYSQNSYGLTSDMEGHAEVYRYIGKQMPEPLKVYYPMLF